MKIQIPEVDITVLESNQIILDNGDIGEIRIGQPCVPCGDGLVKRASAADVSNAEKIIWLVSQPVVDVGGSAIFQRGGIVPVEKPIVPGSWYFLGVNVGQIIENDAPPLPNATVRLGFALTQFKLACQ